MKKINQKKLKQFLKTEAELPENHYNELMEITVEVGDLIFDQIIMEEGISLYF